jgi:hypothetical protein
MACGLRPCGERDCGGAVGFWGVVLGSGLGLTSPLAASRVAPVRCAGAAVRACTSVCEVASCACTAANLPLWPSGGRGGEWMTLGIRVWDDGIYTILVGLGQH